MFFSRSLHCHIISFISGCILGSIWELRLTKKKIDCDIFIENVSIVNSLGNTESVTCVVHMSWVCFLYCRRLCSGLLLYRRCIPGRAKWQCHYWRHLPAKLHLSHRHTHSTTVRHGILCQQHWHVAMWAVYSRLLLCARRISQGVPTRYVTSHTVAIFRPGSPDVKK